MKTMSRSVFLSVLGVMGIISILIAGWYFGTPKMEPPKEVITSPLLDTIRIVAFGDSLTSGYGLSLSDAYPAILERSLGEKGYRVEVVNSGVSGETSAGGVRRAEFIRSLSPDIVLFGLGGNDALRLLSPEEMEKNLDEALSVLRGGDRPPEVLILGMRAPGNADSLYRTAFDAVAPRLAQKYDLPLVPFFLEGVALLPQYTQADGIHPNQAGYQYIVEKNIAPRVEAILSSLDTPPNQVVAPEEEEGAVAEVRETPALAHFFDQRFDGRDFTLGRVLEENSDYTRYYITYKSGELTISGIMNVPRGKGPFPVLILNHGYIDPAIYTNGRGLKREQDYLARQGFVVIHPDYRNHAQSSKSDEGEIENRLGYVTDVINVVYALRASDLPYVDKAEIGMLGHSMGGGIAQTVAVVAPNLVKAIVLYAPVSMDYRDSYYQYMADNRVRAESVVSRYGLPEANPEFWDGISPKTYSDRISVPILLFQGSRDESVPKAWSDATATLLKQQGKSLEYVVYPGEAHEFGPEWGNFMEQTTGFFREYLGR